MLGNVGIACIALGAAISGYGFTITSTAGTYVASVGGALITAPQNALASPLVQNVINATLTTSNKLSQTGTNIEYNGLFVIAVGVIIVIVSLALLSLFYRNAPDAA